MLMTLAALPAGKRKRHYFSEHDLQHMEEVGEVEDEGEEQEHEQEEEASSTP
jgi:hypothetical protein